MNVQSVTEDEDFPVFKAGPPIPIRTKSTKSSLAKRKVKNGPLKATTSSSPSSSSTLKSMSMDARGHQNPAQNCSSSSSSVLLQHAESKVKKYIERVKASDELGRKKRIMPEQMLTLEDLYQVDGESSKKSLQDQNQNQTHSNSSSANKKSDELSITEVQDKLRETLRIVKEKDELINKLRESCHDLAIKCADAENRVDEIRFSFGRMPSSISSNCIAGDSSSSIGQRNKVGVLGGGGDMSNQQRNCQAPGINLRRCASDEGLHKCGSGDDDGDNAKTAKLDEGQKKDVAMRDVQTQIEKSLCQDEKDDALSDEEVGHWRPEDDILQETCSNWIEKVQNWKTDSNFNLSQDSGGDRDSGFRGSAEIDIESVRRQKRHSSLPNKAHRKCHDHHGERSLKLPTKFLLSTHTQPPQMSSSPTTTITGAILPQQNLNQNHPRDQCGGGPTIPTSSNNVKRDEVEELDHDHDHDHDHAQNQQHFWPSFSSSQSHSHLNHLYQGENLSGTKAKSLFYEMAEADRNKHSYFQEETCCTSKRHHHQHQHRSRHHQHHHHHHHHHPHLHQQRRLCAAKSLDLLYFPQPTSHPTSEELRSLLDSSLDPPESILKTHLNAQQRSMDKTVKMLDPLLDDATQIALRVKKKSERLAKMLQDACTFD